MKPSLSRLIECVRGLKLSSVERSGSRKVVLSLPADDIPLRLLDLYDALEAYDKDGAPDAADARRMREALDATFRWIRMQGMSLDEPVELVSQILGVKQQKKQGGYDILPAFAPAHVRKKKSWKPMLALPGDRLSAIRSISEHRKMAGTMGQVVDKMGAAAPVEASSGPGMR